MQNITEMDLVDVPSMYSPQEQEFTLRQTDDTIKTQPWITLKFVETQTTYYQIKGVNTWIQAYWKAVLTTPQIVYQHWTELKFQREINLRWRGPKRESSPQFPQLHLSIVKDKEEPTFWMLRHTISLPTTAQDT